MRGPEARMVRDHPRVCGEHGFEWVCVKVVGGSSPRVRGALDLLGCVDLRVGIIPACAGSTGRLQTCSHPIRDHPRVCGEHSSILAPQFGQKGSSPRVRGAPTSDGSILALCGIIPACAGSTVLLHLQSFLCGDHPRVCGEHPSATSPRFAFPGSSPRVRGALCSSLSPSDGFGIIPACAGSTTLSLTLTKRGAGSSPRVRGTRCLRVYPVAPLGIIPACAGSTLRMSCPAL